MTTVRSSGLSRNPCPASPSCLADRPQNNRIRKAGLVAPALRLPLANGRARGKADQAVHLTHIVASGLKVLLHGPDITPPHSTDRRPCAADGGAATHPISEVTNEERIEIGLVILLENVEVVRDQKSRSQAAGGHQEKGRRVVARPW